LFASIPIAAGEKRLVLWQQGEMMSNLYERYKRGAYQEVYEILVGMQEAVYEDAIAPIAGQVAQEMMKRVRWNLEVLVRRLKDLHYYFGEGLYSSKEEQEKFEKNAPVLSRHEDFRPQELKQLQAIVGPLPLTLQWWYQEVVGVNLVGTFPISESWTERIKYGEMLDPLFIFPVDEPLQAALFHSDEPEWLQHPEVLLSFDRDLKYGTDSYESYHFRGPRQGFDFMMVNEPKQRSFVDYLRQCILYGGFPGLEQDNQLSPEQFAYLTEGLLSF
jgi:hypothetical protein